MLYRQEEEQNAGAGRREDSRGRATVAPTGRTFSSSVPRPDRTSGIPIPGARSASSHPQAQQGSTSISSSPQEEIVMAKAAAPRIPTLLLLAMFAIAARYGPVAPRSSSVSPAQSKPGLPFSYPSPSTYADEVVATGSPGSDSALPLPPSGVMWAAGDGFLSRAKALLDHAYANSRPSTCQALLLMGYREIGIGAMAQSWLYVGMAVRMAQDLGMHRSSDRWLRVGGPIFPPREQQIRKRIWYACVVMDKYVSTYIGRPLSIFESDYDTQLPGVEEVGGFQCDLRG